MNSHGMVLGTAVSEGRTERRNASLRITVHLHMAGEIPRDHFFAHGALDVAVSERGEAGERTRLACLAIPIMGRDGTQRINS